MWNGTIELYHFKRSFVHTNPGITLLSKKKYAYRYPLFKADMWTAMVWYKQGVFSVWESLTIVGIPDMKLGRPHDNIIYIMATPFLGIRSLHWYDARYKPAQDSKVHGANMGRTWVLSAPDGPHVGPMNLVIGALTPFSCCCIMSTRLSDIAAMIRRNNGSENHATANFSAVILHIEAANQRKHQSSATLTFVRGIHRRPVNSPHKWPVTWKMFPFDDVIMAN